MYQKVLGWNNVTLKSWVYTFSYLPTYHLQNDYKERVLI